MWKTSILYDLEIYLFFLSQKNLKFPNDFSSFFGGIRDQKEHLFLNGKQVKIGKYAIEKCKSILWRPKNKNEILKNL